MPQVTRRRGRLAQIRRQPQGRTSQPMPPARPLSAELAAATPRFQPRRWLPPGRRQAFSAAASISRRRQIASAASRRQLAAAADCRIRHATPR